MTTLAGKFPKPWITGPITEPIGAERYMDLLVDRQTAWKLARTTPDLTPHLPPLLEWLILPGEELLVQLPQSVPAPKPARAQRRYRTAESMRQERDRLVQRMAQVAGSNDTGDRAAANLSPHARSRAARTGGRRRFEQMDRALETYARLGRRLAVLNGRIALAETRELRGEV